MKIKRLLALVLALLLLCGCGAQPVEETPEETEVTVSDMIGRCVRALDKALFEIIIKIPCLEHVLLDLELGAIRVDVLVIGDERVKPFRAVRRILVHAIIHALAALYRRVDADRGLFAVIHAISPYKAGNGLA